MPRPLSLYGGRISVTEILQEVGLSDLSMIPRKVLEKARRRGVGVHEWIKLETLSPELLEGVPLPDEIGPYILAWRQWKIESGFKIRSAEQSAVSDLYRFGGTWDLFGEINSREAVVDYKARYAITPEIGPQLSGYEILLDHPGPILRFALLLKPNGTYRFEAFEDPEDRQTFIAANYVAQWRITNGITSLKKIRGRP